MLFQNQKKEINEILKYYGFDSIGVDYNRKEINMSSYQNNTIQSACISLGTTPLSLRLYELFKQTMNLKSVTQPEINVLRFLYSDGSEESHKIEDIITNTDMPVPET